MIKTHNLQQGDFVRVKNIDVGLCVVKIDKFNGLTVDEQLIVTLKVPGSDLKMTINSSEIEEVLKEDCYPEYYI